MNNQFLQRVVSNLVIAGILAAWWFLKLHYLVLIVALVGWTAFRFWWSNRVGVQGRLDKNDRPNK